MKVTTIGLDLAKSIFQVHGVEATGQVVVRKSLRRSQILPFFAKLPSCLIGIEARGTSHHWARELIKLGHEVRLMPPAYVKPYVKRGKTDAAEAEAVCEAVTRPTMRFVPVKSLEQQAALSMHRTRDLLVKQRTQQINMIRGLLAEFGVDIPKGLERALLMARAWALRTASHWTAASNLCLCSYVKFSRRARDATPDDGEMPPIDFSNKRNKRLTFPDSRFANRSARTSAAWPDARRQHSENGSPALGTRNEPSQGPSRNSNAERRDQNAAGR